MKYELKKSLKTYQLPWKLLNDMLFLQVKKYYTINDLKSYNKNLTL